MLDALARRLNLSKLSRREQYIAAGLAALLVLLAVVQLVVRPLFGRNERLAHQLKARTAAMAEMQKMRAEYAELAEKALQTRARFDRRQRDFTLFKFLDRLAGEAGIKGNIRYMKPSTTEQKDSPFKISRVEMKLESITLEQLVDYLYRVETSENLVSVRRMSITKPDQKDGRLTAVLQVETLES